MRLEEGSRVVALARAPREEGADETETEPAEGEEMEAAEETENTNEEE